MNLDDLRMILAITRAGSMTAAARTLYVSQPALSRRLKAVEREIGAAIFERYQGTHRLTLTPAGRLILPLAERWEELQRELRLLQEHKDG